MSLVPWLGPTVQKEKDGIYSLDFITSLSKERFHTLSPLCKQGYLINLLMTDILSCVVRKQLRTQESILIVKSL